MLDSHHPAQDHQDLSRWSIWIWMGLIPCGQGPLLSGHHVLLLSFTASLFHASSFAQGPHSSFQCIEPTRFSLSIRALVFLSPFSITFQFLSCLASSPLTIWHPPMLDEPSHPCFLCLQLSSWADILGWRISSKLAEQCCYKFLAMHSKWGLSMACES